MILTGLGSDIIEIERIRRAATRYKERFFERHFTEREQAYCKRYKDPIPHFAGRFAAKEAVAKALGTGIGEQLMWHDIEILNDRQGKPEVLLSKKGLGDIKILVSISHCRAYASATAIVMKKGENS